MRGKKPNPAGLRAVTGNEKNRRGTPSPSDKSIPSCPAHVTGPAKTEWYRVVKVLHEMGVITVLDRAVLARYSQAYGEWVSASKELKKSGGQVLTNKKKGTTYFNPWWSAVKSAREEMQKAALELGLSPVSRARIKLPGKKRPAAVDKLKDAQKARRGKS